MSLIKVFTCKGVKTANEFSVISDDSPVDAPPEPVMDDFPIPEEPSE